MDMMFDWRHRTDTMRWIERDALGVQSENLLHSHQYKATKTRPLLKLLRKLELPKDSNFVDIGAGKGRVLFIASQYGFRKVIGIEFSSALCELTRKNIESFVPKKLLISPIEVVEADAARYCFEPADRVFFMFNPFDACLLAQVLGNIRSSLSAHPRQAWLIYNDPQHDAVIREAGIFGPGEAHIVGGTHFRVYSNGGKAVA